MIEVKETPDIAVQYYNTLLENDSSNAVRTPPSYLSATSDSDPAQAAWRRKAGVFRKAGKIGMAVEELSAMLDTFYTEVEGWLELADIYASCQQCVSCGLFR